MCVRRAFFFFFRFVLSRIFRTTTFVRIFHGKAIIWWVVDLVIAMPTVMKPSPYELLWFSIATARTTHVENTHTHTHTIARIAYDEQSKMIFLFILSQRHVPLLPYAMHSVVLMGTNRTSFVFISFGAVLLKASKNKVGFGIR